MGLGKFLKKATKVALKPITAPHNAIFGGSKSKPKPKTQTRPDQGDSFADNAGETSEEPTKRRRISTF